MKDLLDELLRGPEGLLCGICKAPVNEPVIAEDGHSYCRHCIQEWFQTYEKHNRDQLDDEHVTPVSPKTGQRLKSKELKANYALREITDAFVERVKENRELRGKVADLQVSLREVETKREDTEDDEMIREMQLKEANNKVMQLQKHLAQFQSETGQQGGHSSKSPRSGGAQQSWAPTWTDGGNRFQMEIDQKNKDLKQATMDIHWLQEQLTVQDQVFRRCAQYLESTQSRRNAREQYERELRTAADELQRMKEQLAEKNLLITQRDEDLAKLRADSKEKEKNLSHLRNEHSHHGMQDREVRSKLNEAQMEIERLKTQLAMRPAGGEHAAIQNKPGADAKIGGAAVAKPGGMDPELQIAKQESEITRLRAHCDRSDRELARARASLARFNGQNGAANQAAELQQLKKVHEVESKKVLTLMTELQSKKQQLKDNESELRTATGEVSRLRSQAEMKDKELRNRNEKENRRVQAEMERMKAVLERSAAELAFEKSERQKKEGQLITATHEITRIKLQFDDANGKLRNAMADRSSMVPRTDLDKRANELAKANAQLDVANTILKQREEDLNNAVQQAEKADNELLRCHQRIKFLQKRLGDDEGDMANKYGTDVDLFLDNMGLENERHGANLELENAKEEGVSAQLKADALEQELRIAKDVIADLRETIGHKEREIRGVQRELNRAQDLITGHADDELRKANMEIDRLQASLERRDGELQGTKEELDRLLAAADRKDAELHKADAELGRLQAEIDQREEEITAVYEELTVLREAQKRHKDGDRDALRKDSTEVARLKVMLEHREEELRLLKAEPAKSKEERDQVDHMQDQLQRREVMLRKTDEENARLKTKVERLEKECIKADEEIKRLREAADELRGAGSELAESANTELARQGLELAHAQAEIQRLRKQLKMEGLGYAPAADEAAQSFAETVGAAPAPTPRPRTAKRHVQVDESPERFRYDTGASPSRSSPGNSPDRSTGGGGLSRWQDYKADNENNDHMQELERLRRDVMRKHEAFAAATEQYDSSSSPAPVRLGGFSSRDDRGDYSPSGRQDSPLVLDSLTDDIAQLSKGDYLDFSSNSPGAARRGVMPPTTLIEMARTGTAADIFKHMQSGEDDVDLKDGNGMTPLIVAASAGRTEVVRTLCTAGANVDVPDSGGCTALHQAARGGHADVVRCLCAAGADRNKKDLSQLTPLFLAANLGNTEVVRMLLALKASSEICSDIGESPLQSAAFGGHLSTVRLICDATQGFTLRRGVQDSRGWTPLFAAAYAGHADVIRYLIHMDAPIDTVTKDGATPLTIATMHGHREASQVLREAKRGGGGTAY
eukprot:TRINITY_DN38339_c0_g1_i1.p1 TRINITY_DN38339_c0_g1~~TRINITY_DN38339_c0_g1_i1.p1  ORF type:complete len:1321 (-),score=384.28 TRINITY_DN38339_c0_g1_i1:624-4586(-)